ncbi:MAG: hypothetical protein CBC48_07065 [bacterium TMED88]|nr:hypothetical protein [Deltaproteobacteria bacterium]OUV33221.1 MAG: hypothetical protein CBC48_07065 [bacterium TMED88]
MIPVGLARGPGHYEGLIAPWNPSRVPELPEFEQLNTTAAHNHVFDAVRDALYALGLDAERFGSTEWNPLSSLVPAQGCVVLKPNFIRHWNPQSRESKNYGSVQSVITHGAVVRAMAEYAFLAVGSRGRVVLAEASQQDCDFERIREIAGLDAIRSSFGNRGLDFEIIDLRREAVNFQDGVIVNRQALPGDPAGYRAVDLGDRSFFTNSGLDPARMRGADYDPGPTSTHHSAGRNAYLLSETVLSSDLIINLPKLKTHKKTGVTLALKNMVGINGDKNWLPHHCAGAPSEGGDEFPGHAWVDRSRSWLTEIGRQMLRRGIGTRLIRLYRRTEQSVRGDAFIRAGNWHGNRTTWRMCGDLNRCVYYSDAEGFQSEARRPLKTVLTVLDGIVAGEGNGPLAPEDVPLGAILASTDPIAVDLVAIRLMGFDERRIPKVWQSIQADDLRVTEVHQPTDVIVHERNLQTGHIRRYSLDEVHCDRAFMPHPGWLNAIERSKDQPAGETKATEGKFA